MAVNNIAKAYSNMEFPLSMKRQDAFALDPTCVWPSLAEAQNYAKTNPTAYIGQVLSVVADGVATAYTIQNADVTGNPYYVTFNTLTDVVVSSGIWNKSDGRIEF